MWHGPCAGRNDAGNEKSRLGCSILFVRLYSMTSEPPPGGGSSRASGIRRGGECIDACAERAPGTLISRLPRTDVALNSKIAEARRRLLHDARGDSGPRALQRFKLGIDPAGSGVNGGALDRGLIPGRNGRAGAGTCRCLGARRAGGDLAPTRRRDPWDVEPRAGKMRLDVLGRSEPDTGPYGRGRRRREFDCTRVRWSQFGLKAGNSRGDCLVLNPQAGDRRGGGTFDFHHGVPLTAEQRRRPAPRRVLRDRHAPR